MVFCYLTRFSTSTSRFSTTCYTPKKATNKFAHYTDRWAKLPHTTYGKDYPIIGNYPPFGISKENMLKVRMQDKPPERIILEDPTHRAYQFYDNTGIVFLKPKELAPITIRKGIKWGIPRHRELVEVEEIALTYEQAQNILEKLDEGVDAEKSAELYKNGDILLRKGMDNALKIHRLYEGNFWNSKKISIELEAVPSFKKSLSTALDGIKNPKTIFEEPLQSDERPSRIKLGQRSNLFTQTYNFIGRNLNIHLKYKPGQGYVFVIAYEGYVFLTPNQAKIVYEKLDEMRTAEPKAWIMKDKSVMLEIKKWWNNKLHIKSHTTSKLSLIPALCTPLKDNLAIVMNEYMKLTGENLLQSKSEEKSETKEEEEGKLMGEEESSQMAKNHPINSS